MRTTTYQLYTNSTAATSGAVYIDLPQNGTIVAVQFNTFSQGGAGTAACDLELSLAPVSQFNVNNPRGVIARGVTQIGNAIYTADKQVVSGIAYDVRVAQRLYLNLAYLGTAPASVVHQIVVHVAS